MGHDTDKTRLFERLRTAAPFAAASPLLAAVLLLAGCPPTSSIPGDTPQTGSSLVPCTNDDECAATDSSKGFVCDRLRRACICTRDAMCAGKTEGPYCNAFTGRCEKSVAGCKGDNECPAGKFCDPALRACRDRRNWCDSCTVDEECGGDGNACIHHPDFPSAPRFCGKACGGDADCGGEGRCADTERGRQCVPTVGRCHGSTTCTPDSGKTCRRESECNDSTQTCDLSLGFCIAKERTCQQGQSCDPVTRSCVQACKLDSECVARLGEEFICRNNTCIRSSACIDDADCTSSNQFCAKEAGAQRGVCKPTCNADSECPLGQRCFNDPMTARRRCTSACSSNADCALTSVCEGGVCQSQGPGGVQRCQIKEACDFRQFCQNGSCLSQPQHCQSCASGCGAGGCTQVYYNIGCTRPSCGTDALKQFSGDPRLPCWPGTTYACEIMRCVYKCPRGVGDCPKGFDCVPMAIGIDTGPWCVPMHGELCR